MEISNLSPGVGSVAVTAQSASAPQVNEKTEVTQSNSAGQQDFQVDVKDGLKGKLAEFVNLLENREQLIKSLPADVQKAVTELLEQMSSGQELPKGLTSLLQGQKNIGEQLKNMSNLLEFTAVLTTDQNKEIQGLLQKILENFTSQSEQTPEQAATQLLQLAKELSNITTMPQGNLKQAVEQMLEQTLPENLQELLPSEQKIVTQLTKLLGKDMPAQLQQLVQENDLPELPGVWATLKAADAWQLKDVKPQTLQAAADLLKQLAQEMPHEKTTITNQLEQFVKTLPTEVGEQTSGTGKMEQFIKNIPAPTNTAVTIKEQLTQFAATLPRETPEQVIVANKMEEFIKNLPPEISDKIATHDELEQTMKKLPTEVLNQPTSGEKIQNFIKTISTDSAPAPQTETDVHLEQFIKTLPAEIGKALQQALQQAVKQGSIPDSLRSLAETFKNAALLNEKMSSEAQSFVVKIVENFAGKPAAIPADVNDILGQLAKQFTDTATTVDQMKNLLTQLKTQLFADDPKLLEKEKQILDQLSKLFEQNTPQALQDGAVKHKLTDLPKVWLLLKALGAEQWQNLEPQNLQKSAEKVKELAQSMYKSTGMAGEKEAEHSILSFSVPLQVAEGIFYPAHIHIFHQEKNKENEVTDRQFETWLRVSVDTEHIGVVDSVFRLYGDNKLDVRVNFPSSSAANEFMQDLPDIRKNIENSKLTLTDIMINKT